MTVILLAINHLQLLFPRDQVEYMQSLRIHSPEDGYNFRLFSGLKGKIDPNNKLIKVGNSKFISYMV